jgi:hypothetical protein
MNCKYRELDELNGDRPDMLRSSQETRVDGQTWQIGMSVQTSIRYNGLPEVNCRAVDLLVSAKRKKVIDMIFVL